MPTVQGASLPSLKRVSDSCGSGWLKVETYRKFLVYIEMQLRDGKKGADDVADLIQLDMAASLAKQGTTPEVKVAEVTEVTNE